jgi:hypothetical protein
MDLKIEAYTEKSIVVCGNTKDYKDQLKEHGGKWNSNLTKNGEKFGGWIYPISKKSALEKWIGSVKKDPVKETLTNTVSNVTSTSIEKRLTEVEDKLNKILDLLQNVSNEGEFKTFKSKVLGLKEKNTVEEDDEEDEEIPKKRLLRK